MIPNLHKLIDPPVARTNMIKLEEAPLAIIRRMLTPVSNTYAIDFVVQNFNKIRGEKHRDYHVRVHREVKKYLRKLLKLEDSQDVKYELHRLPDGKHVYFYLAPTACDHTQTNLSLAMRIDKICQQLIANDQSLTRIIQGLFSLQLKMVMLEQVQDRFPVPAVYFNSALYLNARLSQAVTNKSNTGVMEAFELDVFSSEQLELSFTLHKCKFLVEPADELHLTLDDDRVWFNTDNGRVRAQRKLDARDTKLEFFRDRSRYGDCQVYTYNVVMNAVAERLKELEIPFVPISFQATHELNQFVTDLDQQLTNTVVVVNNGVKFSTTQEAYFFGELANQLPGYKYLSLASLEQAQRNRFVDLPANTSILMLNPVSTKTGNSIRLCKGNDTEFGNFFAAYDISRKQPNFLWDTYTQLKIDRLNAWLQQEPLSICMQGINIDVKLLAAIDYINELSKSNPAQYTTDLAKPRSRLKTAFNLVHSKLRRTKTELWFKESLLTKHQIPLQNLQAGHYTAYSVRITDNRTILLGYVELTVKNDQLYIVNTGVTEGDLEWLAVEHPSLARLDKLFNNGFYLFDHVTDALLTTYNSVRVPRLIGPAHFNVVDMYAYQEQEKELAESAGVKFCDYTITRTAKAEQNVLPYLISPGRSIHDPLTKSQKMKHHHIYLQPHEQGLYVLISNAQPANQSMVRATLVENLLICDAQGIPLDVFSHPLVGVYLNSFTLDMLKSGDSSKSSIFAKLARLMVDN